MTAEHINPFLMASTKVLKDMCLMDVKIGKPFMKDAAFTDDSLVIMIGIIGELQGQVMIEMSNIIACEIASKMCMMPIHELDELSMSAISELGNMIMGNAATVFSTKGIGIDITTPTLSRGNVAFDNQCQNLCVPMQTADGKEIYLNMMMKD